jgi:hypothetical protein
VPALLCEAFRLPTDQLHYSRGRRLGATRRPELEVVVAVEEAVMKESV